MAFLISSRRLIQLSLLILLSSSCAWADDGARQDALGRRDGAGTGTGTGVIEQVARAVVPGDDTAQALPLWKRIGVEIREVVDHVEKLAERQRHPGRSALPTRAAEHADKRIREACRALVTPGPVLVQRQNDDGQVQALSQQLQQLSDQSRAVSQASQQVSQASQQLSQSSQQLSQSLQQASQQLSQTRDQLASARAQSSAASQAAQQASDAARQASDAASQASSSASSAIASAIASASQSASDAISANFASVTHALGASAASIVAVASQSAANAANQAASVVKQAQADATAVKNEADTQVQQAQGAAVSVTQAALAIVGAIIGSSLLTIVGFTLVLRYRRIKRRKSRLEASSRDNISYPALAQTSNAGYGPGAFGGGAAANAYGFPFDLKEPPRAAPSGPLGLQRNPEVRISRSSSSSSASGRGMGGVGFATSDYGPQAARVTSGDREFTLKDAPKGKLSLFPRAQDSPQPSASTLAAGSPQSQARGSKIFPPSLDTWLRAGTVSPFGTLQKDGEKPKRVEWPMKRRSP